MSSRRASNYVMVGNWDIHLDIHETNWLPDDLSHLPGHALRVVVNTHAHAFESTEGWGKRCEERR